MRIKKTLMPIILILTLLAGCISTSQPVPTDRDAPDRESSTLIEFDIEKGFNNTVWNNGLKGADKYTLILDLGEDGTSGRAFIYSVNDCALGHYTYYPDEHRINIIFLAYSRETLSKIIESLNLQDEIKIGGNLYMEMWYNSASEKLERETSQFHQDGKVVFLKDDDRDMVFERYLISNNEPNTDTPTSTSPTENKNPAFDSSTELLDPTPIYRDTLVSIEKDNTEPPSDRFNLETGEVWSGAFQPMYVDLDNLKICAVETWYAIPSNVKYGDANTSTNISFWVQHSKYDLNSFINYGDIWQCEAAFDSLFNLNLVPEMISNEDFEVLEKKQMGSFKLYAQYNDTDSWMVEELQSPFGSAIATYLPNRTNEWVDYFPYNGTPVQKIITGLNYTVTTPAGVFKNCIEVYTSIYHTKTYLAPDIGEVLMMTLENDGEDSQGLVEPWKMLMYYKIHE